MFRISLILYLGGTCEILQTISWERVVMHMLLYNLFCCWNPSVLVLVIFFLFFNHFDNLPYPLLLEVESSNLSTNDRSKEVTLHVMFLYDIVFTFYLVQTSSGI